MICSVLYTLPTYKGEKKKLQDTVIEKNEALQKSEEKSQQLLEELEQYKVCIHTYS